MGALLVQYNTWTLSAGVIAGDDTGVGLTILHWKPNQQGCLQSMTELFVVQYEIGP